ncbi:hypothetical protein K438DRAFT_1769098 [Mycena galopus ATCC 62051]|nr:hypothetical protein K438DRAFT_1769098 [Mycena galopus ATCC 62051]
MDESNARLVTDAANTIKTDDEQYGAAAAHNVEASLTINRQRQKGSIILPKNGRVICGAKRHNAGPRSGWGAKHHFRAWAERKVRVLDAYKNDAGAKVKREASREESFEGSRRAKPRQGKKSLDPKRRNGRRARSSSNRSGFDGGGARNASGAAPAKVTNARAESNLP